MNRFGLQRHERGAILILAMLALLILAAVMLQMWFSTDVDKQVALYHKNVFPLRQAAHGAFMQACATLLQDLEGDGLSHHCWMGRTGRISLPMKPGARFLRLVIFAQRPTPEPNPGWCRVNGGSPEPFDNYWPHIHLPIRHVRESRLVLDLELERAYRAPGDERDLALDICGIQYLS